MSSRPMVVTFTRRGRVCSWRALRPPRTVVPGPSMAAGGDLPHDLYTFVIEAVLGIERGFWGCVAAGATFRSLGRKRTPQGRAVIARHLGDLDLAEVQVNEIHGAWRAGRPTPVNGARRRPARAVARAGRRRGADRHLAAHRYPLGARQRQDASFRRPSHRSSPMSSGRTRGRNGHGCAPPPRTEEVSP